MLIKENQTVLFQGDSVTDCDRDRENDNLMGDGYPNMIAAQFSALYPEMNVKFINRGVSGDRVINLEERWQKDCLDINPDWVSILIGINDCWRRYDSNDPTSVEKYEEGYRNILTQVKEKTSAKIIILEPFALRYPADRVAWREDLDPKIQSARKLAREFGAIYIPIDGIMASACAKRECSLWSADGVHPTQVGHALITEEWMKAVGAR